MTAFDPSISIAANVAGDFRPSVTLVADSVSPWGTRLCTVLVHLHRFMLPELNTHRDFSRNSGSHRAIPVKKLLDRVMNEPAVPLVWRSEQKGMQGGEPIPDAAADQARTVWLAARNSAAAAVAQLVAIGVHKSIANRLIEPFLGHTVVISATNWQNFFDQRCSPLAQDEIRVPAELIRDTLAASTPQPIDAGGWHLPFVAAEELAEHGSWKARRMSAARCARASYLNHNGTRDIDADMDLFERLATADPPHASPLEHVATPLNPRIRQREGNFRGWRQLRHMVIGA